jgi:hypothetical protein
MDSKTTLEDDHEVPYLHTDFKPVISDNGASDMAWSLLDCQEKQSSGSFHKEVNHGKTYSVWEKGELIYTSNPQRNYDVDSLLASVINGGVDDIIRKHSKFKFRKLENASLPDETGITSQSIGYGWIIWKYWRVKIPVLIFDRKRYSSKWIMNKKLHEELFDDMGHYHEFISATQTHGIKCSSSSNIINGYVAYNLEEGSYFTTSLTSHKTMVKHSGNKDNVGD